MSILDPSAYYETNRTHAQIQGITPRRPATMTRPPYLVLHGELSASQPHISLGLDLIEQDETAFRLSLILHQTRKLVDPKVLWFRVCHDSQHSIIENETLFNAYLTIVITSGLHTINEVINQIKRLSDHSYLTRVISGEECVGS